jgi:hypothetical protein
MIEVVRETHELATLLRHQSEDRLRRVEEAPPGGLGDLQR